MVEYLPWSKKVLNKSILLQNNGFIPTLDIELTAKCTGANCIYCDSKPGVCTTSPKGELNFSSLKHLISDAKSKGLEWVYTCGLGEPMEDNKFWNTVHFLKSLNIGFSIFSNGVFIDDIYVAQELKNNNVNIILKMDTFDDEKFDIILGKKGVADKVYAARDYLLEAGYGNSETYTDLAFSIVPTSYSIEGIPRVIEFCEKNGVFASIGELEQAGEVITHKLTSSISITNTQVEQLKKIADKYAGSAYMRPICPCIVTGLHIDNFGNCIVDKDTGLNCKWFLLNEPNTIGLGNIEKKDLSTLFNEVISYRKQCFQNRQSFIKNTCGSNYTFGGCGGNPKDIIELVIGCI